MLLSLSVYSDKVDCEHVDRRLLYPVRYTLRYRVAYVAYGNINAYIST